ncbi:cytochrome aa3 quinol oxidase subunit II [Bacillus ginsengihumi]|uniref:Quinol oxidase subunit 2 n=2 Tax=Heyndrickxia ginsengihumi TaxID=363870 RepID=A0A6M0P630_9BACI|nr:cytochrome aa3 quinol oxidase subunit II [Heyndrickxia ginsengihumi]
MLRRVKGYIPIVFNLIQNLQKWKERKSVLRKLPWKLTMLLLLSSLFLLSGCSTSKIAVLNPQGPVAERQYHLIVYSTILMAIVFVVVLALFFYMVFKYRESNLPADYKPKQIHGNKLLETIWTIIPIIIIIAIAIPTVKANSDLEKVPKESASKKPLTIYVTSADWKWIFSYPEQGIETVNYVNIPTNRPIKFELTSADTMASFWVPELGGQKYTMANMTMQLILQADHPGSYTGRNANFNGEGFAHMDFEVQAQKQSDFNNWVKDVKGSAPKMKKSDYEKLIKVSGLVGRQTYVGTHLKWIDTTPQHSYGAEDQSKKNSRHDMSNMDMSNMNMGN